MQTLADLRRRIAVGMRLLCIENTYRPELNGRVREITRARASLFYWKNPGDAQDSTTHLPKASELQWVDADTFRIDLFGDRTHSVTLRFVA